MANRETLQDASALLYAAPFIICGVYALYLWFSAGISAVLPSAAYLTVTRSPYVFAAGSLAVFLGIAADVDSTELKERQARLSSISNMLISMAIASLVLSFIFALYSTGFNVTTGPTDFIMGSYSLVFPTLLMLLSFLLAAQFRFEAVFKMRNLGVIAMALVPASLYVLGRHHLSLAIAATLVLVAFAFYAFLFTGGKSGQADKPAPAK